MHILLLEKMPLLMSLAENRFEISMQSRNSCLQRSQCKHCQRAIESSSLVWPANNGTITAGSDATLQNSDNFGTEIFVSLHIDGFKRICKGPYPEVVTVLKTCLRHTKQDLMDKMVKYTISQTKIWQCRRRYEIAIQSMNRLGRKVSFHHDSASGRSM